MGGDDCGAMGRWFRCHVHQPTSAWVDHSDRSIGCDADRLAAGGQAVVERHAARDPAEPTLIGPRSHRPVGALRESTGPHEPRPLIISHQASSPCPARPPEGSATADANGAVGPARLALERPIRLTGRYSGQTTQARLGNYSASIPPPGEGGEEKREGRGMFGARCSATDRRLQLDKARSMHWMARARLPLPRAWRASRIWEIRWLSLGAAVWPAATERSSARVSAISSDC